jgi:galactokinase/mevalonate kinase-like predicted kinase
MVTFLFMLSSFENSYKKNNEIVIRQQKKTFWRKQEIKNKTKNIKQMKTNGKKTILKF